MKSIVARLNQEFPDGIYAKLAPWLRRMQTFTSINYWYRKGIRQCCGNPEKTPPWASELYQLVFLAVGVVALSAVTRPPTKIHWFGAALFGYRSYEIFLFALNWVFTDSSKLHSFKRSLGGFLLNFVELILYFAYLPFVLACIEGSPWESFYSSLRTAVTIGPTDSLINRRLSIVLISAQISVCYFLIAIVIASLIGSISKKLKDKP